MMDNLLTILLYLCMIFGTFSLLLCAAILVVVLKYVRRARRRVRRIEYLVNTATKLRFPVIRLTRANLTNYEAEEIKAHMRRVKEQEARDQDTIDKATEYQNDFD